VARTEDSRRVEDARHRDLRAHRIPHAPNAPATTDSNVEDISSHHLGQMVSIDFFTVPTVTLRVLFVFVVLEHRRRQVLHFNVTEHPTAAWTSQQIVEAFAERDAPRYLPRDRDRDSVYGNEVCLRIASLGIEELLTAPQSLWQNPFR
jgi:putative transposase